jgi:hypothetical protein
MTAPRRPLVVAAISLPGAPRVRVLLTQPDGPGTPYYVTTNTGDDLHHARFTDYRAALAHHGWVVSQYLNPDL